MHKTNKLLVVTLSVVLASASLAVAQDAIRATGFPTIPVIVSTNIPGAPILGQPQLINGTAQDIRTEKHGLAYPAFYDWNGDGKLDLLLGEFETGQTGSNIKVYLNEGTQKKPKYSGKYFYATDSKGDTITNFQWCCIGIHPRFVDIDNDGKLDILSGQYNPGQISWWKGQKGGFAPRVFIDQEGYREGQMNGNEGELDPRSNNYWNYSSAHFADFDGDGLLDLFVGGFGELRVARNEGTADNPKFGLRKYLLGIDGKPLSVVEPTAEQLDKAEKQYQLPHYAGVYKSFMTPVDWDGDGVLDLLVTHLYGNKKTKDPVVFFRGVMTDKGLRFEKAQTLFTIPNAYKTFPGCQPNITVVDYNNDGIKDLVIGISLPTVNGFAVDSLTAWGYLNDFGIEAPGKDAGLAASWSGGMDSLIQKVKANPTLKQYYLGKLTDYKYLTLRHRGFVYVMLGKKNRVKAVAKQGVIAQDEVLPPVNATAQQGGQGPVKYEVKGPALMNSYDKAEVAITFTFDPDWYGYANTEDNVREGWIPTTVSFDLPEGFQLDGALQLPPTQRKGPSDVYKGTISFIQRIKVNPFDAKGQKVVQAGDYMIGVNVQYQTCDNLQCLPPEEKKIDLAVRFQ